ncbi:MAG: peptidase S1 [Actinobacteria bacterium]|nr:MAG: peptidase S1 [Actinomycetota bacterium]
MALGARRHIVLLISIAMLVAACGGDDAGDPVTTITAGTTSTTTAVTTTSTEQSGAASGLTDVRSAVVRIVAEGSFVDPVAGAVNNVAGSGSGFFIDPSGLAVTNNHVVTGAAFLQVFVEGESEPLNAKIVAVSECSDLAVIDIDGGGFPYLDWFEGDIVAGTDIYAAGFPLGDPEYTVTEGIISKEKADGETNWASVDSVIQHTAKILPGNSGGPLVTTDGKVIGINYAVAMEFDINEAISRDEALDVIADLMDGNDVNSIGVNGSAFWDGEYSGIWVSGVESGSPAAELGIKGGDIITKMEGLVLATDGTKADYCDILRSRDSGDPMVVEILRFDTGEVLEGILNGDGPLELAFSFVEELGDEVGVDTGVVYEYTDVYDNDGAILMRIPTTWFDIDGRNWEIGGELVGNAIAAAPDLDGFYSTWSTPGVFFGISEMLYQETEAGDLLDSWEFSDECGFDGRFDYEDAVYTGAYDLWVNCGGTDTSLVVLEAYPYNAQFAVLIQIQIVTEADLEALDVILATFDAVGS